MEYEKRFRALYLTNNVYISKYGGEHVADPRYSIFKTQNTALNGIFAHLRARYNKLSGKWPNTIDQDFREYIEKHINEYKILELYLVESNTYDLIPNGDSNPKLQARP